MDQQTEMQIDTALVELLGARITELSATLPTTAAVNPIEILRWPGVMKQAEIETEPLFDEASTLLDATLNAIDEMRLSEGSRIAEMLESRCREIDAIAKAVRKRMPEILTATRAKRLSGRAAL